MSKDTKDILAKLGKYTKNNQAAKGSSEGDKKDPNKPLADVTTQGQWNDSQMPKRPKDSRIHEEPIDKSKGEEGQNDSDSRQDASTAHAPVFKGKGTTLATKIKESVSLNLDMDAMKNLLESTSEDEEFILEALEIFEATMKAAIDSQMDTITEAADEVLAEAIEEEIAAIEEQVEDYLNIAIMEWTEDNRLAIEQNVRATIAESFMQDLKGLMESYSINLPEESVDLYEHSLEVGEAVLEEKENLEAQLAEATEELNTLHKAIFTETYIKDAHLTVSESERVRAVAEQLDFRGEKDFLNKLETISEGFVGRSSQEDTQILEESVDSDFLEVDTHEETFGDPTVSALAKQFRA